MKQGHLAVSPTEPGVLATLVPASVEAHSTEVCFLNGMVHFWPDEATHEPRPERRRILIMDGSDPNLQIVSDRKLTEMEKKSLIHLFLAKVVAAEPQLRGFKPVHINMQLEIGTEKKCKDPAMQQLVKRVVSGEIMREKQCAASHGNKKACFVANEELRAAHDHALKCSICQHALNYADDSKGKIVHLIKPVMAIFTVFLQNLSLVTPRAEA